MLSQIFIDSCDDLEIARAKKVYPDIAGVTTNPSLLLKNPEIQEILSQGHKLSEPEAFNKYREIIIKISQVTTGPISIQVIADSNTPAEDMLKQAKIYHDWIPNVVVKFPITYQGLFAAGQFCERGMVNLTLNFTQEQALAVYQATKNAKYPVFISPFVGRLDNIGVCGMDIVKNNLMMFDVLGSFIKTITSSVRGVDHILYAIKLNSPAITVPDKVIQNWQETGFLTPGENFTYHMDKLQSVKYQELDLNKNWRDLNIHHQLTDDGLDKFMIDWRSITK